MKNNEMEKTNSRRSFIRKAAYAVPTVIAISQITSPMSAQAASSRTQIKPGSAEVNPNNAAGTDASDAKNIFGRK